MCTTYVVLPFFTSVVVLITWMMGLLSGSWILPPAWWFEADCNNNYLYIFYTLVSHQGTMWPKKRTRSYCSIYVSEFAHFGAACMLRSMSVRHQQCLRCPHLRKNINNGAGRILGSRGISTQVTISFGLHTPAWRMPDSQYTTTKCVSNLTLGSNLSHTRRDAKCY